MQSVMFRWCIKILAILTIGTVIGAALGLVLIEAHGLVLTGPRYPA